MADLQGVFQHLNAIIERKIQALHQPGLAFGITNRERLLFVGHYGLANRDTNQPVTPEFLFQIGSISKSFTSIILLQLQEQDLLNLDDPVTQYLPWFEVQSEFTPITLRNLMSHTAGIITGSDDTIQAFNETWNLRFTRATAPPGEMFHYSNTGYKALGLVLETVVGQPIGEILRQRVLSSLRMESTEPVITNEIRERLAVGYSPYYDDRPHRRGGPLAPATWFESETADGSICSTAEDMCRYLRALLNRGAGILSPASFDQLIHPVIATGDGLHGEAYGLGVFTQTLDGRTLIGHGGGMVGYLAHLLADLDSGLGFIAMTNSPYSPETITSLARELLVAHLKGEEIPAIETQDPDRVEHGDDCIGRYHCGTRELDIAFKDEHLYLGFEGDSVLLEPAGPDVFLVPHPAFELFPLRFERESPSETEEETITAALHGPDVYLRNGISTPSQIEIHPEWRAYPGHYRSHNPWLSNFRVILRNGQLILIDPDGDEETLYPQDSNHFRVGDDPRSPEFIEFDLIHNGKAMRVNLSGGAYSRTFTP